jgi:hypothetical protein
MTLLSLAGDRLVKRRINYSDVGSPIESAFRPSPRSVSALEDSFRMSLVKTNSISRERG